MDLTEKICSINDINLHVVEKGDVHGRIIIFLHGFPEFWYGWRRQLDFFADKGYRVVVPDQRGYNLSSKPNGIRNYTLERLSSDIAGLINLLTDKKVVLVGHDWGGNIAWAMATHYPHLLDKLIILNIPHPKVMRKYLLKSPKQMLKSWYMGFFQLPFLPELLNQIFGFRMLRVAMVSSARKGTFSDQDIIHYERAWSQPGALRAMINWYRAIKYSSLNMGSEVNIPTLMLWGQQDAFLQQEMASLSMACCKNGKLVFVADATHWLHHEKSQEVNATIQNFIEE